MMYVQENEETMPVTDFWSVVDGASGKILICPTAGKKIANAYGYSNRVAGVGLGEIQMPTEEELTMDAVAGLANNLLLTLDDVEFRHTKKAIVSYVDGHVTLTNAVRAIYAKPVSLTQPTTIDPGMSTYIATANTDQFATSLDGLLQCRANSNWADPAWKNYIKYDNGTITITSSGSGANNSATYSFSDIALSENGGYITKGWEVSFVSSLQRTLDFYYSATIYDNSTPAKVIASVLLWRNDEWWSNVYNGRTNVYLNGTAAQNRAIEVKNPSNMSQAQQVALGQEVAALMDSKPTMSISVTASGCTLIAGKYAISLPMQDATANWNMPTKIEFNEKGNGGDSGRVTSIYDIKFAGI